MRGRACWGYASSFAVLLRQLSKPAGGAIQPCDKVHALWFPVSRSHTVSGYVPLGALHCLHPIVSTTGKQGFCTGSNTPCGSKGEKFGSPEVALGKELLNGGPMPGEGSVEDDVEDEAGATMEHNGSTKVVGGAGVNQATLHTTSNNGGGQNTISLLSYLTEQGFTEADLKVLQQKYPAITKLKPAHVKSVLEFFQELGLSNIQIVKLVCKQPRVVSYSVGDKLQPIVQWLVQQGVHKSKVGSVLANWPTVLGCSIEGKLQPTLEWLLQYVDKRKVGSILTKQPQILGYSIENNLQPTLEWLLQYVDKRKVGSILAKQPQIFGLSIEDNLQPTLEWLLQYVGRSKVGSVLTRAPQILGCSIEDNLRRTLEWLLQYVGRSKVGSMLTRAPMILGYSIEDNLQPTLDHLIGLGLKHENIHKVLQSNLFSLSIEAINAKCDVLRHKYELSEVYIKNLLNKCPNRFAYDISANFDSFIAAGFTRDDIKGMVTKDYMALQYNVLNNTYKPKLHFYLQDAKYKLQDIAEHPRLLMHALDTIESRWNAVQQASMQRLAPREFRRLLDMKPDKFEEYLARLIQKSGGQG